MIMRSNKTVTFIIMLAVLVIAFAPSSAQAAGRVSMSPTPVNLTEGQSQVITVTLDEPIIAEEGEAFVTLTITNTNPSRLTSSVSSVTWTGAQWAQSRTFTLTAVDDLVVNGDLTDVVDVSVTSNSEYYDAFAPAFVANVLDNDVQQVVLPEVLPAVGDGSSGLAITCMALLAGFVTYALRRGKLEV